MCAIVSIKETIFYWKVRFMTQHLRHGAMSMKGKTMYKGTTGLAVAVAAAAGITTLAAGQAQAQEQCSFYTVVRGDVLSAIASAADVPGGFRTLFNANTNVLASPNQLEVGQVLAIPCADGSLPTGAARVTAASTAPAP